MSVSARRVAEHAAVMVAIGLAVTGVLRLYQPVRVTGASMYPALRTGDLVLVDRDEPVRVRDIVLFRLPGHGSVLHRVVGTVGAGALRTKGDANPVADLEPVPTSATVGPVRAVIPVGAAIAWWRRR